jgi:hypothetical protein
MRGVLKTRPLAESHAPFRKSRVKTEGFAFAQALCYSGFRQKITPPARLELATSRLTVSRSTTKLRGHGFRIRKSFINILEIFQKYIENFKKYIENIPQNISKISQNYIGNASRNILKVFSITL